MIIRSVFAALLCAACLCFTNSAEAGSTPLTSIRVASGLNRPVFVTSPPGDYERLFIVEQRGVIKILNLQTGVVNPTPFLDLDANVVNVSGAFDERGMLGMAFHPDYANNGFFFLNYINNGGNTVVRRFSVSANPDVALATGSELILTQSQPFTNHNGGMMAFSPNDGYLYIGFGDGGSFDDPGNNGQTTSTRLGKMLRIDVDNGLPFTVPADNPFVGVAGTLNEIWALGLRNPWRWSFDRLTGDMWIGDVGQFNWEEINIQDGASAGGENYAWRCMEGNACYLSGCTCNSPALTDPILVYSHGANRCSVTGGYVYRGDAMPDMQGLYFYADWCSANIWTITEANTAPVQRLPGELFPTGGGSISNIASFGEDAFGEIYIVDRGSTTTGEIYKIVPNNIATLDCNDNLIVDSVEISLGLVPDCDSNGIPDECDVAMGGDSNMNGIPDVCEGTTYVRGDCNDDMNFDLSDAIFGLAFIFDPAVTSVPCESACDLNDDGNVDIADSTFGLAAVFGTGSLPSAPFPACGADPTPDGLSCTGFTTCP